MVGRERESGEGGGKFGEAGWEAGEMFMRPTKGVLSWHRMLETFLCPMPSCMTEFSTKCNFVPCNPEPLDPNNPLVIRPT